MDYNKIYSNIIANHNRRLKRLENTIDSNLDSVLKALFVNEQDTTPIPMDFGVSYVDDEGKQEYSHLKSITKDGEVISDLGFFKPVKTYNVEIKAAILTELLNIEKSEKA